MNGMQSGGSNRKVIGGLVVVIVIGLLLVALSVSGTNLLSFLPFLLILACPLMMIFMMSSMGHSHNHLRESASERQSSGISEDVPDLRGLSRDQQVWALRHALTRMAWRQEALRQTLDQVEADQRAERVVDAEPTATSPTSN